MDRGEIVQRLSNLLLEDACTRNPEQVALTDIAEQKQVGQSGCDDFFEWSLAHAISVHFQVEVSEATASSWNTVGDIADWLQTAPVA